VKLLSQVQFVIRRHCMGYLPGSAIWASFSFRSSVW